MRKNLPFSHIEPAKLSITDAVPYNESYQDIYYSREQGQQESYYTFIDANDLPRRWKDHEQFCIAETGFGTGLNFLLTAQAWLDTRADGVLHYISFELHPVPAAQLRRIHIDIPCQDLLQELVDNLPPDIAGMHPILLQGGRIRLLLVLGNLNHMLPEIRAQVDCWYLDGFAPAKNAQMWQDALYQNMARLSHSTTTFSTFTAAGFVRRGLKAAGFEVRKQAGFGTKREMLLGNFVGNGSCGIQDYTPWFRWKTRQRDSTGRIAIVGGGIAGLTQAYMLLNSGYDLDIYVPSDTPMVAASYNSAGLIYPWLSEDMKEQAWFSVAASLFACQQLAALQVQLPQQCWYPGGVIYLMPDEQADRLLRVGLPESYVSYKNPETCTELSGVSCKTGGLLYSFAGWLQPAELCHQLQTYLEQHRVNVIVDYVTGLEQNEKGWLVKRSTGQFQTYDAVVMACAASASRFSQFSHLAMQQVRGQVTQVACSGIAAGLPVTGDGYLVMQNGGGLCGASFGVDDLDRNIRSSEHTENIRRLSSRIKIPDNFKITGGRVSHRAMSRDRLPIIGQLHDPTWYAQQYAKLFDGKRGNTFAAAEYQNGLYCSLAHGARGMSSAWLAAAINRALILNEPLPIPYSLVQCVHAARFQMRDIRKGRFDRSAGAAK